MAQGTERGNFASFWHPFGLHFGPFWHPFAPLYAITPLRHYAITALRLYDSVYDIGMTVQFWRNGAMT